MIDGRHPFPRVAPPYRHGVDEVGPEETDAPPTLVNNVETMANVPGIMANGPSWFRELGTPESPGTIVCTVSGHVDHARSGRSCRWARRSRQIIDEIGGGARPGRRLVAAMSGVSNPLVTADQFDTPASHEAMNAIGSGLGAAGFIVFDDATDFAEVAYGVSHFLAVESCGQCTPCKEDGLALVEHLRPCAALGSHRSRPAFDRRPPPHDHRGCALLPRHAAPGGDRQHRRARGRAARASGPKARTERADPIVIGPIADIRDGEAVLDEHQLEMQPDWSFDAVDSGKKPAARFHEPHPNAGLTTLHPAPAAPPARGGRTRACSAGACTKR